MAEQHVLSSDKKWINEQFVVATKERDALRAECERLKDIKTLVDKFLGWKLPEGVRPDPYPPESPHAHNNSGTNLLTADEARQMFEYLLEERK